MWQSKAKKMLVAEYGWLEGFQVCCIYDVFSNKDGRSTRGVTARREHKEKRRWLGGHGRRARGQRGTVSANTAACPGQNCKLHEGLTDLATGDFSQDGAHVRLVLRLLWL